MDTLYNIEVTQGTSTPVLEPDVYNFETLLFYLKRFEIFENSSELNRLLTGERIIIATFNNELMSIKLIEYYPLNESQLLLVKGLKWCSIFTLVIAFLILFFFNNFKILIVLLPNAGLLWITGKKLEITSSNEFDIVSKKVLIILGLAMIVVAGISIYML
ncbi:hypothetical protein WH285_16760 [Acinetobacter johnsonii]|uniref:hypothetical protein n=1 Tax=Acinetobacter johnsonii TaxID=40214 RepID=UPI0030B08E39